MARKVLKPWGYELIWAHTGQYVGKILFIKSGEALSLQYHKEKDETIYLIQGKMNLEIKKNGRRKIKRMSIGDSFHIRPRTIHRMAAVTDCLVCEVSTPQLDDVVRLEDKYGRVKS
jgi:mannose-6-phosphate isomerase-like protein (cupin superfamily)